MNGWNVILMKEISLIKEFTGDENFKSIRGLISNNEIPNKNIILQYLKSFPPDCAAGMCLKDEITGKIVNTGVNGYEDGVYYWDTRHIYHFEKYNLILDNNFIQYVLGKRY